MSVFTYTLIALVFYAGQHTSTVEVPVYGKEACEAAGKELQDKVSAVSRSLVYTCARRN